MNCYRWRAVLGILLVSVTLTACAEAAPVDPIAPSASMSAEAAPSSDDLATAQTCAMVSVIETNLVNAESDRIAGVITTEQYAAIVNASALNYKALTVIPPRAGVLLPEATAVVAAIEKETPTSDGASFQPSRTDDRSDTGYAGAATALRQACESRGFPVSVYGGASMGG